MHWIGSLTEWRRTAVWLLGGAVLWAGVACSRAVEEDTVVAPEPVAEETAPTTEAQPRHSIVQWFVDHAHPLRTADDLDPLLRRVQGARLALLGEASHGTSEYYVWRAKISQRLIEEEGFNFVAVEGDWSAIWLLNTYVKNMDSPFNSATEIMETFSRWPIWMWANEETRDLIEWMRAYNADRPAEERVGFYGIDVYGESDAFNQLMAVIQSDDSAWGQAMADDYACLRRYQGDMHRYVQAVAMGAASCEAPTARATERWWNEPIPLNINDEQRFSLKMKAKVVQNAERHFLYMASQGAASWNARVDHFYRATARLLERYGPESRGIVWAHNTHIGDARATMMRASGQHNIGQLAREQLGMDAVVAVGFTTHRGTVQAGSAWGEPMQTMRIPPAQPGSLEDWLHQTELDQALWVFREAESTEPISTVMGNRAVGVIYNPAAEHGNYVPTIVPLRYDVLIFFDETQALRPVKY